MTDYARLRADLVAQAAAVLKQIDGVMPQPHRRAEGRLPAMAAAQTMWKPHCRSSQNSIGYGGDNAAAPKAVDATSKPPSLRGARPLLRLAERVDMPQVRQAHHGR